VAHAGDEFRPVVPSKWLEPGKGDRRWANASNIQTASPAGFTPCSRTPGRRCSPTELAPAAGRRVLDRPAQARPL